ncbi:MAG: TetR/AcrR family transcriptional regulator [Candidatus Pelagadaptatus aseana]|uniref:TetR/AcrR family transcriptional regulator n=1 Tax=Candidatus Pelagadaptatus aseana TaxID=3120508 RepID=UPI0039B2F77C
MPYRPTEKTRAHREAQQKNLLKSAVKLVAEEGFKGLKVSKVAKRADIATGSVYKYFESKQALCAEVFKVATIKEVEKVRQQALEDKTLSCTQRLLNTIEIFAQRAIQGRRLSYALIAEPVDPAVETERLIYRKAYADIFTQLIEEGMAREEFRPQPASISAAAIVGTLSESLVGPLTTAVESNRDIETGDLIAAIQNFCLGAVT